VRRDVLKHPRAIRALVVHHRAVHLLEGAAPLPPLEVHRPSAPWPMARSISWRCWPGCLSDGVCCQFVLEGVDSMRMKGSPPFIVRYHVVGHGEPHGGAPVAQLRVGVPRHPVADLREAPVVEAAEGAHHVRRDGQVRCRRLQRGDLVAHEVHGLVRREALPVEAQGVHRGFARVDLVPTTGRSATRSRPVGGVQRVERAYRLLSHARNAARQKLQ